METDKKKLDIYLFLRSLAHCAVHKLLVNSEGQRALQVDGSTNEHTNDVSGLRFSSQLQADKSHRFRFNALC